MKRPRIVPVLQFDGQGLVKTRRFCEPIYVGDPINALHIFNDKESDEIVIMDIGATQEGRVPNLKAIKSWASECFMPVCYGGGIHTLDTAKAILDCGIEKIIINAAARNAPLITSIAKLIGSQSVVVGLDYTNEEGLKYIVTHGGKQNSSLSPIDAARAAVDAGAGELILQDIQRDGIGCGYDLETISEVSTAVPVPIMALGGAGNMSHIASVLAAGADAAGAASFVTLYGRYRAVLLSYPDSSSIDKLGRELQP